LAPEGILTNRAEVIIGQADIFNVGQKVVDGPLAPIVAACSHSATHPRVPLKHVLPARSPARRSRSEDARLERVQTE
jgi:hypothetical protein